MRGRTNVHEDELNGRPFVVSGDLAKSGDQKNCGKQGFTLSELSSEFPQISRTILY
jgi:hypothetical protein